MLETGLYSDLSNDEYHADRSAVSKSWLDKINQSPAHLKHYLDHPADKKVTPALLFGSLLHTVVLEPDLVNEEFIVKPENINRRTNVGKEKWIEFLELSGDKMIVSQDDLNKAYAMRETIFSHTKAKTILSKGRPEQSVIWNDTATDSLCKARADWIHADVVLVDIKTCEDARASKFIRNIINYRYDVQSAHYEDGFSIDKFLFIAVEKTPPYGVAIYLADAEIVNRGLYQRDQNLELYAQCKASNHWPGYEESIQTIQLPNWALQEAA